MRTPCVSQWRHPKKRMPPVVRKLRYFWFWHCETIAPLMCRAVSRASFNFDACENANFASFEVDPKVQRTPFHSISDPISSRTSECVVCSRRVHESDRISRWCTRDRTKNRINFYLISANAHYYPLPHAHRTSTTRRMLATRALARENIRS